MLETLSFDDPAVNMQIPNKQTFNTAEFAQICGVTQRSVYRWINEGKIKGVYRLGGYFYRVPRECIGQVMKLSSECYVEEA